MDRRVDFFLVGCQKSATTWLHRCFREHPDIFVPEEDELHYFDIHYDRGADWYHQYYRNKSKGQRIGDTTSSYIRSPYVPRRIADYNPDAQIVVSLRNPMDRAFSHYWHERKKKKIAFEFEEIFSNYDLFESWIATGFYDEHLARYYEHFDEDQILVLIFEDLQEDSSSFIRQVFSFLGVDSGFRPSVLDQKVNEAWSRFFGIDALKQKVRNVAVRSAKKVLPSTARDVAAPLLFEGFGEIKSEYEQGMDRETRARLQAIYRPHIAALEDQLGRSLESWT
jgi:hypothetical protein